MSEKLAEQLPGRTAGATQNKSEALTPAERAEREIAQMDEQMDAILDRNQNREALMNKPGQALQPPQGRTVTPGVSAPIPASSFNHMVLNCIVPGSGSLAHGKTGVGLAQLGLAVAALPTMFLIKFWLALLMVLVAYVWSIATGVGFLSEGDSRSWK